MLFHDSDLEYSLLLQIVDSTQPFLGLTIAITDRHSLYSGDALCGSFQRFINNSFLC